MYFSAIEAAGEWCPTGTAKKKTQGAGGCPGGRDPSMVPKPRAANMTRTPKPRQLHHACNGVELFWIVWSRTCARAWLYTSASCLMDASLHGLRASCHRIVIPAVSSRSLACWTCCSADRPVQSEIVNDRDGNPVCCWRMARQITALHVSRGRGVFLSGTSKKKTQGAGGCPGGRDPSMVPKPRAANMTRAPKPRQLHHDCNGVEFF